MWMADLGDIRLNYRIDGDPDGAPIVYSNSLGTDLRLWDKVIARMPSKGWKYIRYDSRGHGLSECPKPPYGMGTLVRDAELLIEHLNIRDAVFVGLSIGGMVAQGLAAKRLDLIRAVVLSNTGARIATREIWADRIADVERGGIEAIANATLQRWFSKPFHQTDEFHAWRNMLTRTPVDGYIGCSHAIAGTDFYTTTANLRLPTLGIAGTEDGSTPPDLVRETVDLVPGSQFELIRKTGHLPCVEDPDSYARILSSFIAAQAH